MLNYIIGAVFAAVFIELIIVLYAVIKKNKEIQKLMIDNAKKMLARIDSLEEELENYKRGKKNEPRY